jgi:TolA-binding protein
VPLYQSKAIENFAEYVKAYPKSEMTPTALMALGTLYSLQDKPQEAEKIYAQLTREYPDSEQAKNVVFAQARSLMDVGQMEKAVKVFEKMFADASKFTPAQFLQAAQAMREARQYPQAIRALQEARKAVDRREVWEPATMALAEAYAAMADWPNTAKAIEEMLAKYPASGYTVNANFLLSRAYAEIGQQAQTGAERFQVFNSAVKAMGKARQYARQADERARADVELASIQLLMEKKNEAMASFQRILLLADYGNPKVVPYIEKALESVVPLLQEAESHADIVESCEAYLKAMPGGRLAVQGRQWRDQAKLKLAASGQPGAAPAPPAGQP